MNYSTGELSEVAGSPFAEKDHTFELEFDNAGKFVYSNTSNSILVYGFNASDGSLSLKQESGSADSTGWLLVDQSLLFLVSSRNDGISVFHRNPETGELSAGTHIGIAGFGEAAIIHFD